MRIPLRHILLSMLAFVLLAGPGLAMASHGDGGARAATEMEASDWYLPRPSDELVAWNAHDPWNSWGTSRYLGLSAGRLSSLNGYGALVGLRYDSAGGVTGFHFGRFSGAESWSFGLSLMTHKAWMLLDLGLPDVQIGALYPAVVGRVGFTNAGMWFLDDKHLGGELLLSGVRAVIFDLAVVDLRPHVGWLWLPDAKQSETSLGLSLQAGVVF